MRPLSLLFAAVVLCAASSHAAELKSADQIDEALAPAQSAEEATPASDSSSGSRRVAQASSVKVKIGDVARSTSPLSVSISAQATPPTPFGTPPYNVEEHKSLDLIQTLNQIDQQRYQQRVRALTEQRDESTLRTSAESERDKLGTAPLEEQVRRMKLDADLRDAKLKAELAPLEAERDRLRLQNDVDRAKLESDQIKSDDAKLKIETALRELDYEDRKLKYENEMAEHKTVALKTDLDLREKKEDWKKQANREPDYELEPFKDGVLTVSDRRITLDGPIISGMADYVTERIHYFNNKDEKLPIFIVINKSPGGSVMEGYRIVKAIQASKAPVHVVVKSFAASMAAVITTLAPHSYAYPNAIILHHQLFAFAWGNPTELKDQLRDIDEWYKRLAAPVAKKMGISLDQYTKEMYKHNSDGDWQEFADRAVELHWVDHIVHEVRETGMVKEPEGGPPKPPAFMFLGLKEETDPQGQAYVKLPRLDPGDAYWIHNPDHYYR